jgi:hypothetical protein
MRCAAARAARSFRAARGRTPVDALARKITERPARAPLCDRRLEGNNGGIVLLLPRRAVD